MSKFLLVILSLSLLISIIYCASSCESKFVYNYNDPTSDKLKDSEGNEIEVPIFEDGSQRRVWNHAHICNTLQVKSDPSNSSCCYIHIEYKSEITGERYDKYGCIDVKNPWEDYGGKEEYAENRADDVMGFLRNSTAAIGRPENNNDPVVSSDNLHTKILCSANFLRLSLSALLVLILF